MLFSRWFRHRSRPAQGGDRLGRSFRPTLQVLEDRTVPSAYAAFFPHMPASGPATGLQVIVPESPESGQTFRVLVEATDAGNGLAYNYTGTVHLSLGTADPGATVPADYTFTARDHGLHLFQFTLSATGSQTITATDTTTGSITGSATTTVTAAPVVTHLLVVTPTHATVGVPTAVTVVALDAANHPVSGYTGTVSLTSSDMQATLPNQYTFTSADRGIHTFQVTLQTTGSQTVTATDTTTSTITGKATTTVNAVGTATHFGVFAIGPALPGVPAAVVVVALDASNHVVTGYTGTVHLTSSDTGATLPADYTFTASDSGVHLFSVTFAMAGRQTLTAADTSSSSVTGSVDVAVISVSSRLGFLADGWLYGGDWGTRHGGWF